MVQSRILLLEDDAALRDVLLEAMAEVEPGIEVVGCSSYHELLSLLDDGLVDGVIADAWGESQAVLKDAERQAIVELGRKVPLVLVTGRTWSTSAEAGDLSAVAILHKPFELEELAEALRRLANQIEQPSTGNQDALSRS